MKNVIWLFGSNSSGKTTQARLIHESLSGSTEKQIFAGFTDNLKWEYTLYNDTAHIGGMRENQCTGTDTLPLKAQVALTYDEIFKRQPDIDVIILDPIMSTGQHVELLRKHEINLLCIYLHFETAEDNFYRVIHRRYLKTGVVEDLSDKTKDNLSRKVNNFHRLYNRAKDLCDASIKINAEEELEDIHLKILGFLEKNMKFQHL